MPELPASVRLALWGTAALSGGVTFDEAVTLATPDIADVHGEAAVARLDLWAQMGERVLQVSLPSSGDLVGVPRGDAAFLGLVVDVGECLWSPLLGGALTPVYEDFGPTDDTGTLVTWEAHECSPPPVPTVGGDVAEAERTLTEMLARAANAMEDLNAPSWQSGLRDLVDDRLAHGRWGLPEGLDPRTRRVLTQAAMLETIAATARVHLEDVSLAISERRAATLRDMEREARRALVVGTCAASLDLSRRR